MEVDCTALREFPTADAHIEPIRAGRWYLHTSPEHAMKELMVEGSGDIYYLGHVFRGEEMGKRHRPEFTMVEWYREGFSLQQMIDETVELVKLFVGDRPVKQVEYWSLFEGRPEMEERHRLLATEIEPALEGIVVVTDFPAEEAALARIEGESALRFEVFCDGYELANGYDELLDCEEHKRRGVVDKPFLAALEKGLPACCGVAVGFDRLMMVRHGVDDIADVRI
jgi:lysyl-tRNA synthetase class 2